MHPPLLNHSPRVLTHRLGFQSLGIRLGFHASSAPLEGILLSTFRVLNFRDWFGAQIIECTFKHMLRSRFRVLEFRDWFRQTKEYYIPGQTKEPGLLYILYHSNMKYSWYLSSSSSFNLFLIRKCFLCPAAYVLPISFYNILI